MLSILFVGSLPETSPHHGDFLEFCENLGRGVAAQHKILICGTTPRTADHSIAQGAFEELGDFGTSVPNSPRITLYHTTSDESTRRRDNKLFDRFCQPGDPVSGLKRFTAEPAAFRQAVADCDIVTLIGGAETSADLVDIAIENQKPVLGFTAFDGTGATAYRELRRVYQLLGITDDEAYILQAQTMEPDTCASYLELVTHVHKRNPWSSKNVVRRCAVLIAVLLALLLVSVGCTVTSAVDGFPRESSEYFALYASCIAAGLLGAYLVFLKHLQTPGDLLLRRAMPVTGQGVTIGFSIAGFAQIIVAHVLSDAAIANDLSFAKLISLSSIMAFGAAWIGITGLRKVGDWADNLLPAS
jgi:hypothetical protein